MPTEYSSFYIWVSSGEGVPDSYWLKTVVFRRRPFMYQDNPAAQAGLGPVGPRWGCWQYSTWVALSFDTHIEGVVEKICNPPFCTGGHLGFIMLLILVYCIVIGIKGVYQISDQSDNSKALKFELLNLTQERINNKTNRVS